MFACPILVAGIFMAPGTIAVDMTGPAVCISYLIAVRRTDCAQQLTWQGSTYGKRHGSIACCLPCPCVQLPQPNVPELLGPATSCLPVAFLTHAFPPCAPCPCAIPQQRHCPPSCPASATPSSHATCPSPAPRESPRSVLARQDSLFRRLQCGWDAVVLLGAG